MHHDAWSWPPDALTVASTLISSEEIPAAFAEADGPRAECRVVLWLWWHRSDPTSLSSARIAELAARYAMRLDATGVNSIASATATDAAAFVQAPTRKRTPPSIHTMHLRRTALRALCRAFHELGAPMSDPTTLLELPSRWFRSQRPLTDAEIHLVRTTVMVRRGEPPPGAVLCALAEAGASTAELTRIRWADLTATAMQLPGGTRLLPRTVALTDWGAAVTATARTNAPPDGLAVSTSTQPPGSHPAQAAVTNRLRWLLRTAGLHADPALGPRSFRLWGAAHTYELTGRIDAAAHVLGMRSLDATAAAIGI